MGSMFAAANWVGLAGGLVRRLVGPASLILCCLLTLAACTPPNQPPGPTPPPGPPPAQAQAPPVPLAPAPANVEPPPEAPNASPLPGPEIYQGRGAPPSPPPQPPIGIAEGGTVTLNFVNAGIREFIDSVLGNTLVVNYTIDPRVQGTVTLRTARPLERTALLGVVEDALAMNGAALVKSDGAYKVVPLEDAVSAPAILQQGGAAPVQLDRGFSLHIIPLHYGSAAALREVLEPFIPSGRALRVDATRNLFIFAGTGPEAADFAELVSIFDVDWMANKSFGLFPLKFADPKNVSTELSHVFGQGGNGAPPGVVDVVPIERLNAVLVITPQRSYLSEARTWIARLDRGVETDRRQLFVYYVQNGRAAELAAVLGQAFAVNVGTPTEGPPGPSLAPGLVPAQLSRPPGFVNQQSSTGLGMSSSNGGPSSFGGGPSSFGGGTSSFGGTPGVNSPARRDVPPEAVAGAPPPQGFAGSSSGSTGEDTLRIVPDLRNNALLIYATGAEYDIILAALKKLDIVPLQVLIEATVAEVTLNDALKYGLEWFLNFGNNTVVFNTGEKSTPAPGPDLLLSKFPGFAYMLALKDVKVVLNALTQITDVKVISSPQLMVLDNQPARLQVGDQVPVAVRTSVSTEVSATSAPIVAEIEYRDTGVILDIIPRVNASGLVVLDIIQEVSDVAPTVVSASTTTTTQATTPTISQRRIATTVAINSGETVALGGLIRESDNKSVSGVPLLSEIPMVGNLFKTTSNTSARTELLVLLTPRVVRDRQDARTVTEQLRQRLRGLIPLSGKIQ
jgi:general secretion pathway protein D